MASIVQQSPPPSSRYARIPAWLRDLDFVTDGFTWLFRLLSRGAESLMTLSTIYIIIEAGVPVIALAWLHNLAVAIMISAPEIILPGGFILASDTRAQGNRRWWMLAGMCWVFVVLTGITLADLFIWHFSGEAFAALMWGRCAAAVGYSILFRVIAHRCEVSVLSVASLAGSPTTLSPEEVEARTVAIVGQVADALSAEQALKIEQSFALITEQIAAQLEQAISAKLSALAPAQPPAQLEQSARPARPKPERSIQQAARFHVIGSHAHQTPRERVQQALKLEPGASDRRLGVLANMSAATAKKYRAQVEQELNDQAV